MAYIHCAKCDWQQDDFYTLPHDAKYRWYKFSLGYNPISKILTEIGWLWKPRLIKMDIMWAREHKLSSSIVFSWRLFWIQLGKIYSSWQKMRWYTIKSLKADKTSHCPKCGLSGKGWWVCD